MSWLGDKIRWGLDLFNSEEHLQERKVPSVGDTDLPPVKDISEPIITFVDEGTSNPARFQLYLGADSGWGRSGRLVDYLLLDSVNKKSFSFSLASSTQRGCGEGFVQFLEGLILTSEFKKGNFKIKTEDLGWVTEEEKVYLLQLFNETSKDTNKVKSAKTKRKQANQRRRMRKLYETK